MAIGDYPVDYNPKVHGPYDPARYYGKPDTPLSQVKLGEVTIFMKNENIIYNYISPKFNYLYHFSLIIAESYTINVFVNNISSQ